MKIVDLDLYFPSRRRRESVKQAVYVTFITRMDDT